MPHTALICVLAATCTLFGLSQGGTDLRCAMIPGRAACARPLANPRASLHARHATEAQQLDRARRYSARAREGSMSPEYRHGHGNPPMTENELLVTRDTSPSPRQQWRDERDPHVGHPHAEKAGERAALVTPPASPLVHRPSLSLSSSPRRYLSVIAHVSCSPDLPEPRPPRLSTPAALRSECSVVGPVFVFKVGVCSTDASGYVSNSSSRASLSFRTSSPVSRWSSSSSPSVFSLVLSSSATSSSHQRFPSVVELLFFAAVYLFAL